MICTAGDKMSKVILYVIVLILAATSSGIIAQDVTTENGLSTATYETPKGNIKVHYPQRLLAGDSFTGTVVAEPKGESEEEKAEFADKIGGYVVEVNDSLETSTEDGSFQWVMPPGISALQLVLRDSDGNDISSVNAPIVSELKTGIDIGLESGKFYLPSIGQVGHPARVDGPFDGDISSTGIAIGEAPANMLAESPRAVFFKSPDDLTGVHPIDGR
jgi:hypothetical protein